MPIFPSLAEMAKEPSDPTVNVAVLGLRNSGWFTTVTGNEVNTGLTDAAEPAAIGAISAVNVPLVPAGGLPNRVAVLSPLSIRTNQGGADLKFQETWVRAPMDVTLTELDAPAMNVASAGRRKVAAGAGTRLMPKPWIIVPCEFDAITPQPALPLIRTQATWSGRSDVPLMVPVPLPLSVNFNPGKWSSNEGVTDKLSGGIPVAVTWKLTGNPAVPVSIDGEVIPNCWLTSIVKVCSTGLAVVPFEAARVSL